MKLRTVPEDSSTTVEFDVYMGDVKFFGATRVLSVRDVQFFRAKLYGDFLKCSVALWKKGRT